jgi:hypothetical protein
MASTDGRTLCSSVGGGGGASGGAGGGRYSSCGFDKHRTLFALAFDVSVVWLLGLLARLSLLDDPLKEDVEWFKSDLEEFKFE